MEEIVECDNFPLFSCFRKNEKDIILWPGPFADAESLHVDKVAFLANNGNVNYRFITLTNRLKNNTLSKIPSENINIGKISTTVTNVIGGIVICVLNIDIEA